MAKCSIVIRAYNEEKFIGKLFDGIYCQTEADVEVILVDSGSTDRTLAIARQYPVRIVSIRPQEFSFGYALNVGCQAASSEFLVFASAHVYPIYKDWLTQMLLPFSDPKVGLVYGKQRGNELTKYSERQLFKKWFPEDSNFNQHHAFCNNANVAIRRAIWEQLPYDESLTGLEDLDWATKAMGLGWRIAYNAEATIAHVHEETPAKIKNRYMREAIALKHILPDEKFSFADFLYMTASNIASDCFHALQEGLFWKHAADICVFRTMQFWGTYKGYRVHRDLLQSLRHRFYYPNKLSIAPASDSEARRALQIDYEK